MTMQLKLVDVANKPSLIGRGRQEKNNEKRTPQRHFISLHLYTEAFKEKKGQKRPSEINATSSFIQKKLCQSQLRLPAKYTYNHQCQ